MKCVITILLVSMLISKSANSQAPSMSKEEREAYLAKLREASQADHKEMMRMLSISSLRPGANGSDPTAPNAANYDESKANPYPDLPDPLKMNNGKHVRNAKMWWDVRRPEIMTLFDQHLYGIQPDNTPEVRWELKSTAADTIAGIKVLRKVLVGHVDNTGYPEITVDIDLTVVTPEASRVPLILSLSFNFPPGRTETGPDWKEQLVEKGWGFAEFTPTTVQPDNGAGLSKGIIGLMNKGSSRKPEDWGALKAWAWGASRILDCLEIDPQVDAKRVGITGHSRYGKAAAVAMAYDPRFAIAYISSSGEGGLKLHRRNAGEIVENVAASGEYHWMCGNFIKYAGPLNWNDLPVDAHELIALCAPRPIFIGCGSQGDEWSDPKGMFLAGVAAGSVYEFLGKKDLGTKTYPSVETGLTSGEIAFRQHSGGHTPAPNWPVFIQYADRYIGRNAVR